MELKLVKFDPEIKVHIPSDLAEPMHTGFWIRSVSNLDREVEILRLRRDITDSRLERQRHQRTRDPSYTTYSPATFVCPGVPISLFASSSDCGVMIQKRGRTIPYWYDGLHGEQLTREMDFSKGSHLTNGHDGQHWEITEEQIAEIIRQRYDDDIDIIRQNDENELDNHGVLFKKQVKETFYTWNEGLFRYKKEDIFGIYVNPESKESCHAALSLREKLRLNTLPLYSYHDGNIMRVRSQDIIARWFPRPESAARSPQAMFSRAHASARDAHRPLVEPKPSTAFSSRDLPMGRR